MTLTKEKTKTLTKLSWAFNGEGNLDTLKNLVKKREKHATKVGEVTDDNIAKSDLPNSLNTMKSKFNARIDELKKAEEDAGRSKDFSY